MSIVSVTPPLEGRLPGDRLEVASDAASSLDAVAEIEDWCFANRCERVDENHLNTRRNADGQLLRIGHCWVAYQ